MGARSSSSFPSSLLWRFDEFSTTDQGCKTTNIAEDIWLEIFLHLPLTSIFKFKCVSKVWFSLLSNPYFISKWIKHHTSLKSVPWALFYEIIRQVKTHVDGITTITTSYPITSLGANSEIISPHNGLSFKFLAPPLHERDEQLHVVGSGNGLVLLTPTLQINQIKYVVYNPLTEKWVALPPPPQSVVSGLTMSALVSECFPSTCYKVVRIPNFGVNTRKFSLDIFCSDRNEWTICEVSCPETVTWRLCQCNEIASHYGNLLWIEKRNRIVAYDLNKNKCRLINLPAEEVAGRYSYSLLSECLNVSEGFICYARVRYRVMSFSLSAWVLKESWQLLQKDIQL
ncbi:F-box protein At3g26010-like [Papaver somniferum]|uniref:F-box protein At3g26010-like n=1 Tax=Papaver somniferum TaxID=3469 RepID=UPI000E6FA692|nr:F-box protein At3g26010-like [Papaver somniferum]